MIVQGLVETITALASAAATADKSMGDVIEEASKEIVDRAGDMAPRRSGHLAGSLYYEMKTSPGRVISEIGSGAWYDHFVEYGTARTAPQPFYAPASEGPVSELEQKIITFAGTLK